MCRSSWTAAPLPPALLLPCTRHRQPVTFYAIRATREPLRVPQELDSGAIVIDGINIAKLGVEQLRASMAIIPQARARARPRARARVRRRRAASVGRAAAASARSARVAGEARASLGARGAGLDAPAVPGRRPARASRGQTRRCCTAVCVGAACEHAAPPARNAGPAAQI
jgi:hypothetical protein